MSWRLAKSLEKLRSQVNAAVPNRNKAADGTIGDAAHSATKSEHNPDANGVVRAMDITHDPARGVDTYAMAESLRQSHDPRILYVISNGRIFSSERSPWVWRTYNGSNKHNHHVHVSVVASAARYDSTNDWTFSLGGPTPAPAPNEPAPKEYRDTLRRGDDGDDVKYLQGKLGVTVDGDFGPLTEQAVKAFQRKHKLVVDGVVGPYTWDAIDK